MSWFEKVQKLFKSASDGLSRISQAARGIERTSEVLKSKVDDLSHMEVLWAKVATLLNLNEEEQKIIKDVAVKVLNRNLFKEFPRLYLEDIPTLVKAPEVTQLFKLLHTDHILEPLQLYTQLQSFSSYITLPYLRSLQEKISLPNIDDTRKYIVEYISMADNGTYKYNMETLQQYITTKYPVWKHVIISVLHPNDIPFLTSKDLDYDTFLRFAKAVLGVQITTVVK